ncbi:MAG: FadR family transcriptional regulator [Anaerolineae bacterium]|nr:FadR family transcriptional regulator [Anaerolineae bacterium]MCA9887833.1 FadR family transcriptional regulator [Anaerolineae bacterium]MCA9893361.1 FadR family transcriptional regulator [Anaerolineae bacterium]
MNHILSAGYEPGETLPTIKELASREYLGVSTSKIREQLEVARALGIVDVRSRTGTQLKPLNFAQPVRLAALYALGQNPESFEQLNDLRIGIEVTFWQRACETLTEQELCTMREMIENAHRQLNSHPIHIPFAEHRKFHLTMFKKLDNPFVIGILEAYWDVYDVVASNQYAEYSYLLEVWQHHENILDAIVAGNFDAALEYFIKHTQLRRYQHPIINKESAPK